MAGRKRSAPAKATRRGTAASQGARPSPTSGDAAGGSDVPLVYREMLSELGAGPGLGAVTSDSPERPLKRRRAARRSGPEAGAEASEDPAPAASRLQRELDPPVDEDEEEEDVEFEDVALPVPTVQTAYRDSDEEEEEDPDLQFEDVDFGAVDANEPGTADSGSLTLNLSEHIREAAPRRSQARRKPISKAEKERRLEIHKMHVLCLISHVEKRNHWCNDPVVQESLSPLLTEKMVTYLNPSSKLSQFGQTESLKNGIKMASEAFRSKFLVTERGLRRALWAEEDDHLKDYQLPDDMDSCYRKAEFRKAAHALRGSRDVGAQLFCALLRSAGVETRLVCSLQPLYFVPGGPTMRKPRDGGSSSRPSKAEEYRAHMPKYITSDPAPASGTPSPRRRLGHPNAAAYNVPDVPAPSSATPRVPKVKKIWESEYPVYWAEVLDVAHRKWAPVDPLVTNSQWKPARFEPPASDRQNAMSYVVAFEADGSARDVTKRYAKAYNSKTRRTRVDGPAAPGNEAPTEPAGQPGGQKWWRKAMKRYRRRRPTDLDQIEDHELAAVESREPMPRNVQDFKDHPVYALERHLRRHEVLRPGAQVAGTVGAGSRGPLEKIYRRSDVRVAHSADKWYRLGRVVKLGEEPVRVLPKKAPRRPPISFDGSDPEEEEEGEDEDPVLGTGRPSGVPLFVREQTEPYVAPPVRGGRVPRNKFGNIDVYVPSMVPPGGVHIRSGGGDDGDGLDDRRAAHAAFLLGVDYAPALTGFRFRGRKGTAVLDGVVVPRESEEAVRAVVDALGDLAAEAEDQRRAARALRAWGRLLKGLRIRRRIWANVDPDEEERGGAGGLNAADVDAPDAPNLDEAGTKGKAKGKAAAAGLSEAEEDEDAELADAPSDVTEEYYMDEDGGGGGFLVE